MVSKGRMGLVANLVFLVKWKASKRKNTLLGNCCEEQPQTSGTPGCKEQYGFLEGRKVVVGGGWEGNTLNLCCKIPIKQKTLT